MLSSVIDFLQDRQTYKKDMCFTKTIPSRVVFRQTRTDARHDSPNVCKTSDDERWRDLHTCHLVIHERMSETLS